MRLESFKYQEWQETPREWILEDLAVGNINLLVGKNASGKTRCLNVIYFLARLFRGQQSFPQSGKFVAIFENEGSKLEYRVKFEEANVVEEFLSKDGKKPLLLRGENGIGKIFYDQESKNFDFQLPPTQLAAVARQDSLQHKFLLPLNTWAASTFHYPFATEMGRKHLAFIGQDGQFPVDFHDPQLVIGVFRKGQKDFGEAYERSIIDDMAAIGYDIKEIGTKTPTGMTIEGPVTIDPICLYVQERSLRGPTEQLEMSQGMFRALSTLIHLSYGFFSKNSALILIDDIGEGLDFDRSTLLIDIIINKVENSNVQLIMATNDRFVMNAVPLEYWSVLARHGSVVSIRNFHNSRQKFEDFKFTGMNNFDFFTSDFLEIQEKI